MADLQDEIFYSVEVPSKALYTEKKSEFYGLLFPLNNENQVTEILKQIKKEYVGARHYCYAYILRDGKVRASDDGEPQGTAGIPILEILKKNNLTNVLLVVVRFFGGILLGASGLCRAYAHAGKDAVENAEIFAYKKRVFSSLVLPYSDYNFYSLLLSSNGAQEVATDFAENVTVSFHLPKENFENLQKAITEKSNGKILIQSEKEEFAGTKRE